MANRIPMNVIRWLAVAGIIAAIAAGGTCAATATVDPSDVLGWASADVPFARQSGYAAQVMGSYPRSNAIPETGIHGSLLPHGETLRFGKVPDPVDPSRQALAFQLDPGDPITASSKRSEISFSASAAPIEPQKVYWVAYRVFVYNWGRLNADDTAIFGTQLHSGDNSRGLSPAFSVVTADFGQSYRIDALYSTSPDPQQSNTERVRFPSRPLPFDRWIDFVFKFRIDPTGDGLLQVWVDGELIVDYHGRLGFITPGYADYQKFGYYNWSKGFNSPRKILLQSPVIVRDPTGDKYDAHTLRAFVYKQVGIADPDDMPAVQEPLDRYVPGAESASFRSSGEDPDAVALTFKAGDNGRYQGHLDMGSFVLDAQGVRWAEELGLDTYSLPGYFGSERWHYYRNRPEGHNTLVIDPQFAPSQDPSAVGRIVYHKSLPDEAVAIADLTQAYHRQATRVRRGVALFDKRRQVLIQDEIALKQPADVWWFMHTKADIVLSADGRSAILSSRGKQLAARILSPGDAQFSVLPAVPLPTSPQMPGQNSNSGMRKLAIHLAEVSDVRLAVQLAPLHGYEIAPSVPALPALDEWTQAGESGLWGEAPRLRLNIQAPSSNEALKGKVPLQLAAETPPELAVQRVEAYIDRELVYRGTQTTVDSEIEVRSFADGPHTLSVQIVLAGGEIATYTMPVQVANWWYLSDPLDPPFDSGWFGTVVRTFTSSESAGWEYAAGSLGGRLNDPGRKVRRENSTEYLIWEAPNLRRFSLQVYAQDEKALDALRMAVSADGQTWQEVTHTVEATEQAANGWRLFQVQGEVVPQLQARWCKVTLVAGDGAPDSVQIGHMELSGISD